MDEESMTKSEEQQPLSLQKALQQCELIQNMIDLSISNLEGSGPNVLPPTTSPKKKSGPWSWPRRAPGCCDNGRPGNRGMAWSRWLRLHRLHYAARV